MQVRILEILEVSLPSRRSTCLFGYILHALACTFRYQAKLRLAIRNQGAVYGSKRGLLLRNPMQSIERNHEIKLVFEPQATSVRHLKSEVGQRWRTEVALGEAYIFPPISISDCDYDYEHEYEYGFLHSGFVIPSSFVIRASSFSHHSLINSRRSPSLPLCSLLD